MSCHFLLDFVNTHAVLLAQNAGDATDSRSQKLYMNYFYWIVLVSRFMQ